MYAVAQPPISHEPDPRHQASLALLTLIKPKPKRLTYTAIENALLHVGLDPYEHEDQYLWILDALDAQQIAVVDQGTDPDLELAELEVGALDDTDEMREILRAIVGDDLDSTMLLNADEEKRLLELVAIGKGSKEELQTATSDLIIDQLEQQIRVADAALQTLVQRNIRLVANMANKYAGVARHMSFDDLVQEGLIGLSTAIQKFD